MSSAKAHLTQIEREITEAILLAIKVKPGSWQCPWHSPRNKNAVPVNIASSNNYNGINRVRLWAESFQKSYPQSVWGTKRQWEDRGCWVRVGERSTFLLRPVFANEEEVDQESTEFDLDAEVDQKSFLYAVPFEVFNIEQVKGNTGYTKPALKDLALCLDHVDHYIAMTNADFRNGAEPMYFAPPRDFIQMPSRDKFGPTDFSSATETYQSTRLHELAHWSGASFRLDRPFGDHFGDDRYAFEELVAELASAFLCAELEIGNPPRQDHAQYLQSWLRQLKSERRLFMKAASKASQAVKYLNELQVVER